MTREANIESSLAWHKEAENEALRAEKDALLGDLANIENGQRVKGQP